jgi:hypothetical protein
MNAREMAIDIQDTEQKLIDIRHSSDLLMDQAIEMSNHLTYVRNLLVQECLKDEQ